MEYRQVDPDQPLGLVVGDAEINDSQYDDDGNVVALSFDTDLASAGDRVRIAMFEHATRKAPELVVTYKPTRAYVVMQEDGSMTRELKQASV